MRLNLNEKDAFICIHHNNITRYSKNQALELTILAFCAEMDMENVRFDVNFPAGGAIFNAIICIFKSGMIF